MSTLCRLFFDIFLISVCNSTTILQNNLIFSCYHRAMTDEQFYSLTTFMDNVTTFMAQINERMGRIEERMDQLEKRMDALEARTDQLEDEVRDGFRGMADAIDALINQQDKHNRTTNKRLSRLEHFFET